MHAPGLPRNQSLRRAVALLRALAERPEGASAATLARATDLPPATVGRLLATLADVDLVERPVGGDGWVLGHEAVRLGRAASPFGVLAREVQPLLEELADQTGESAMIGVSRAGEAEVIAQADPRRLVGLTSWVGRPISAVHATTGGKLYLAGLPPASLEEWTAQARLERLTPHTIATPPE